MFFSMARKVARSIAKLLCFVPLFYLSLNVYATNKPTFLIVSLNEAISVYRVDGEGNAKFIKRISVHADESTKGVDPIGNILWAQQNKDELDKEALNKNAIKLMEVMFSKDDVVKELKNFNKEKAEFLIAIAGFSGPEENTNLYSNKVRDAGEELYKNKLKELLAELGYEEKDLKLKMVSDTSLAHEIEIAIQPTESNQQASRAGFCQGLRINLKQMC